VYQTASPVFVPVPLDLANDATTPPAAVTAWIWAVPNWVVTSFALPPVSYQNMTSEPFFDGWPAQISTGSPANVRVAAFAPGAIVGQVPMIVGRYFAEGVSPPPLLDPELLELVLASVMSLPLDPEVDFDPLDPELPLDPEVEFDPELPLDWAPPELDVLFDPELPFDPELLFSELLDPRLPELVPPGSPVSGPVDAAQLAMSETPVKAKVKTTVQRIASSRRGARQAVPSLRQRR
jgi:hypothetical protein